MLFYYNPKEDQVEYLILLVEGRITEEEEGEEVPVGPPPEPLPEKPAPSWPLPPPIS